MKKTDLFIDVLIIFVAVSSLVVQEQVDLGIRPITDSLAVSTLLFLVVWVIFSLFKPIREISEVLVSLGRYQIVGRKNSDEAIHTLARYVLMSTAKREYEKFKEKNYLDLTLYQDPLFKR